MGEGGGGGGRGEGEVWFWNRGVYTPLQTMPGKPC